MDTHLSKERPLRCPLGAAVTEVTPELHLSSQECLPALHMSPMKSQGEIGSTMLHGFFRCIRKNTFMLEIFNMS